MPTFTDWIMAAASVVSAFGFILLCFQTVYLRQQVEYLKKQIYKDNERPRREKAIEMIELWNRETQRETAAARKLVETFDEHKARELFEEQEITLLLKHKGLVETCLGSSGSKCKVEIDNQNKTIKLDEPAVATIRWQAILFLNTFECIASAWFHHVADREIIESEFGYFVNEQKGFTVLETLRQVAGGTNVYPAIEAFVQEIKNKRRQQARPPSPPL